LPGHAIAGWGFKTIIVMLPVVMLNARATSRISFAMGSLLSQNAMLALQEIPATVGVEEPAL